jgi:alkanesulfonate monooxygenase SsuD/methylene tetrahydromethanopterin reductase-like flavin-dependent oxidoreductase (luciferase family)
MKYGFIIPGGDIHTVVALAREAEEAGWDGVFYWDGICIPEVGPMFDPWVTLAAIATHTNHVRIGAIVSPLSRRRPWKVARESTTVDHLSNGRLILPVGLGALDDGGFGKVGEPTDRRVRAELLDESLDILTGLWSGSPFSYSGKHYQLAEMTFLPPPLQQPRIPIWVVGAWPREKSLARALRYDGILPDKFRPDGSRDEMTPDDLRALADFVSSHREPSAVPYDIIMEGNTPGDKPELAAATVRTWADAGATWWNEAMWDAMREPERVRVRIQQGPPRIE